MIDPLWRLMIVVLLILAEALVTCMESALKKANECFFEKKVDRNACGCVGRFIAFSLYL